MHEEFSQVRVAALADAEKSGFAASRMLAGNQTEPGWQITRFRKAGAVADRCCERRRYQQPYARYGEQTSAAPLALPDQPVPCFCSSLTFRPISES